MGMAASQARFLGLTARKSNVEYEGQQINQQRTALGNQTANYYNQMLGMSVPVPPSIDDYTKTIYSFEDGSLHNSITSLIANTKGQYTVSFLREWVDDFSIVSSVPSIVTRVYLNSSGSPTSSPTTVSVTTTPASNQTATLSPSAAATMTALQPSTVYNASTMAGIGTGTTAPAMEVRGGKFLIGNDELRVLGTLTLAQVESDDYLAELYESDGNNGHSVAKLQALLEQETAQLKELRSKYPESQWGVRYIKNTTSGAWEAQFYNLALLTSQNSVYDSNGNSQTSIPAYKVGSQKKQEEVKGVNALLERDATGRIINIILNYNENNPQDPSTVKYAITTTTVADQMKYDDAMNQYEYSKYQYDQTIEEINAKIEIIQSEDRSLELRLKQLDTEQNAIQTEMDAVSKVIEKNVESTFKTFG